MCHNLLVFYTYTLPFTISVLRQEQVTVEIALKFMPILGGKKSFYNYSLLSTFLVLNFF